MSPVKYELGFYIPEDVNRSFLDRATFLSSSSSFIPTKLSGPRSRHCYSENLVEPGIEPGTSGLAARKSKSGCRERNIQDQTYFRHCLGFSSTLYQRISLYQFLDGSCVGLTALVSFLRTSYHGYLRLYLHDECLAHVHQGRMQTA
jgi:hypothetical protein